MAQPFLAFVHPDDKERTRAELTRLADADDTSLGFENRYLCKDGTRRSLQWNATVAREEGRIYAVARDVTALRRAEARARALNEELYQLLSSRSSELERTHVQMERLTSLASGDVADLLDSLNLALDTVSSKHGEGLSEEGREQLDAARRRARYVREVVGDFIEYAALDDLAIKLEATSMDAVIAAVRDRMLRVLDLRRAIIGWQALPPVQGDPSQLRRLLQTLVAHALRFRGTNRPLLTLSCERRGDFQRFELSHNGLAIPPEQEERVFEFGALLRRTDGSVRTTRLATCRRIVELHGGAMGVESGVRDGAQLWFTLRAVED